MAKPHKKINYKKQQNKQPKQEQNLQTIQPALVREDDHGISFRLHALDTWFFRESRPHDAVGASELSSLFPPPVRTLAGALRTYLGEQIGINWQTMTSSLPDFDFAAVLGDAQHLGQLQLQGPWINHQGKRLYPAPLYLMQNTEDSIKRLTPGQTVHCDLGRVRLPELAKGLQGYKTLEQRWLTAEGMHQCLNGEEPKPKEIISTKQLFDHEARLGIARHNAHRKVLDGKLYQTQHLRLKEDVQIELLVKNLPEQLLHKIQPDTPAILRLGGEGRMASMSQSAENAALPSADSQQIDKILIHFVTPADFDGLPFPAHFQKTEDHQQTVWQGEINGIQLSIEAAVIGKVHREGGWDMHNHQPRPVKSYIPAGSCWFCRLDQTYDWPTLYQKLHGHCIGTDSAFGRGQMLLGHWQDI